MARRCTYIEGHQPKSFINSTQFLVYLCRATIGKCDTVVEYIIIEEVVLVLPSSHWRRKLEHARTPRITLKATARNRFF